MAPIHGILGFRVSGSNNSCLDHRQVELLNPDDTIKAVRPATQQEAELWDTMLEIDGALVEVKSNAKGFKERNAELIADVQSLTGSNEAYRRELENLRVYVEANWISPAIPPATVPTLDMFAEIVQSHNAQKKRLLDKAREIWQIPPGTDIFDFMFRQLQHLNGEMTTETEERRRATIRERERAAGSAATEAHLAEMRARSAGTPVRDNPQA